jgi:glutathione S-transferase
MAAGEEEALTLLGVWQSPYAIRARLALNLKGLAYCYAEEEDLFGDKSDLLRRFNPVHKKVPVLIHDGRPVCESQNISEYLDEVFPDCGPRLLPADPYDRAVARFWASYVDDKVTDLRTPLNHKFVLHSYH